MHTDFDESPTTDITVVEEIDDRASTVPRCADCLEPVMTAGPIPPTSIEGAHHASPDRCLRGPLWAWCATHGRFSLWRA